MDLDGPLESTPSATAPPGTPASAGPHSSTFDLNSWTRWRGRRTLTTAWPVSPQDPAQRSLLGVRADKAMGSWGANFAISAATTGEDALGEFSVAEEVDWLDDFVTHDWRTGRWPKYLSLCVVYNSEAAAVASFVSIALFALAGLSSPTTLLCRSEEGDVIDVAGEEFVRVADRIVVWSTLVFWCFFFFWQHLKAMLCGCWSRYIFVDRLCICQSDSDQKKQGIMSLGGYIKRSERMVMLWSTHYFSRLWCTYEIACWLRLGRDFTSVRFIPVDWGVIIAASSAGFSIYTVCRVFGLCGIGARLFMVTLLIHAGRFPMQALCRLPSQLERFSIREAECFCCSSHHRHPETRERLPCDRKLIYSTLVDWFEQLPSFHEGHSFDGVHWGAEVSEDVANNTPAAALDAFDEFVRTLVGSAFKKHAEGVLPFQPRYREALIICFGPGLESFAQLTSFANAQLLMVGARGTCLMLNQFFCWYPCAFKAALGLSAMAARRGYGSKRLASHLVLTCSVSLVIYVLNDLHNWASDYTAMLPDPVLQGGFTLMHIVCTAWAFF